MGFTNKNGHELFNTEISMAARLKTEYWTKCL